MAKTLRLSFRGYLEEHEFTEMPDTSGVFLVYAAQKNIQAGSIEPGYLVYIGHSSHLRSGIESHERRPHWLHFVAAPSVLAFAYAPLGGNDRERAAAALINHETPRCNVKYIRSFPFNDTTVLTSGACRMIPSVVTIHTMVAY